MSIRPRGLLHDLHLSNVNANHWHWKPRSVLSRTTTDMKVAARLSTLMERTRGLPMGARLPDELIASFTGRTPVVFWEKIDAEDLIAQLVRAYG